MRFNGAAALTLRKRTDVNLANVDRDLLQWGRSVNAAETGTQSPTVGAEFSNLSPAMQAQIAGLRSAGAL